MRIPMVYLVDFGPIGLRGTDTLDVADTVDLRTFLFGLLMLKLNVKGDIDRLVDELNVFHPLQRRFLDKSKSLAEEDITSNTPLVVTTIDDIQRLSDIIVIRELTELEKLALEIRRGK